MPNKSAEQVPTGEPSIRNHIVEPVGKVQLVDEPPVKVRQVQMGAGTIVYGIDEVKYSSIVRNT